MKSARSPQALNASRIALKLSTLLPPGPRGHVVLVTSVNAGEGKSFVADLLAREIAVSLGIRLLLADASQNAPIGDCPFGLSKLIGDGDLAGTPTTFRTGTRVPFLPSGAGLSSAVFNVAGVARAFDALRADHPLSVLDGPSLGECGALALHADAIVLVVDSRHTPPDAIRRALALAQLDATRIAGVLLNHALLRAA